jgi:hypothetical protein
MENVDEYNEEAIDRPLIILKKSNRSESYITPRQGEITGRK